MAVQPTARHFNLNGRAWLKWLGDDDVPVFVIVLLLLRAILPPVHGLTSAPDGHNI